MTDRQREVVRLVVLGLTVEQAAGQLNIHPVSVRRILSDVYARQGLRSQAELVGWCVARAVVTVPELQRVYCRADGLTPREAA